MEPIKTDKRIDYISIMNVISIFAVVELHVNGGSFWGFGFESNWISANIIEEFFLFAVPVFFMISGATLLDYTKRYDTKEFFRRRIKKTVIPYVFWCMVGLAYQVVTGTIPFSELGVKKIVWALLEHGGVYVYWFFAPLFCIYLCMPLLAGVEHKKQVFSYVVMVSLLVNQLVPFVLQFLPIDGTWNLSMPITYTYLIYVFIGYLLSHSELKKGIRIIIYVGGMIGLVIMIIGTQVASFAEATISVTYKILDGLPCILWSVAVFVFIQYAPLCKGESGVKKICMKLSGYSFGIYLVHFYVQQVVERVFDHLLHVAYTSWVYRLTGPFIIIGLSIAIIAIMRKIPLFKHIVPV